MSVRNVQYGAAAILIGCTPGSVRIDDGEPFGKVRSGVWFDMASGSASWHSFALLDTPGACSDAQDLFPAAANAQAALALKLEPLLNEPSSQCTLYEAYYSDLADLTDPLFGGGLHVFALTLRDPTDEAEDAPPDGSYERFTVDAAATKPYYVGRVTYYAENPHRIFSDLFACDGSGQVAIDEQTTAAIDSWQLADGQAEADRVGSEQAYKLSVDAALEDLDGKSGGQMTAKGKFDRCEITYEGDTSVTL